MICTAARASRPGSAVGLLRVLCNGMCSAKRFHADEEQNCRVGCPHESDSLTHYNKCPFTTSLLLSGGMLQSAFEEIICFNDVITQTLSRSLQYGIVVMGIIDAFVYAHNYPRRNNGQSRKLRGLHGRENPSPDCNHSTMGLCIPVPCAWAGRPFDFPRQMFRLPAVQSQISESL